MAKHSVAGICFKNGKFFIGKRINQGQMACRWEFPGGKAEEGEDDKIALEREFEEEFGVKINVGKEIANAKFVHNDTERDLIAFQIDFEIPADGYKLTEHTDTNWATMDEIQKLNFVDSDSLLFPQLKAYFNL